MFFPFLQEFTSAGGKRTWETFTLSKPVYSYGNLEIVAVSGERDAPLRFPRFMPCLLRTRAYART